MKINRDDLTDSTDRAEALDQAFERAEKERQRCPAHPEQTVFLDSGCPRCNPTRARTRRWGSR